MESIQSTRDSEEREDSDGEEPLSLLDKKKAAYNSVFGLHHWQHNIGNKPQCPSIQVQKVQPHFTQVDRKVKHKPMTRLGPG